jgi:hypothetical protein
MQLEARNGKTLGRNGGRKSSNASKVRSAFQPPCVVCLTMLTPEPGKIQFETTSAAGRYELRITGASEIYASPPTDDALQNEAGI